MKLNKAFIFGHFRLYMPSNSLSAELTRCCLFPCKTGKSLASVILTNYCQSNKFTRIKVCSSTTCSFMYHKHVHLRNWGFFFFFFLNRTMLTWTIYVKLVPVKAAAFPMFLLLFLTAVPFLHIKWLTVIDIISVYIKACTKFYPNACLKYCSTWQMCTLRPSIHALVSEALYILAVLLNLCLTECKKLGSFS